MKHALDITVVLPVGPLDRHRAHLDEAITSVLNQTQPPKELLIIDNGRGLGTPLRVFLPGWEHRSIPCYNLDSEPAIGQFTRPDHPTIIRFWRSPWAVGLASGFNLGVGLASHECVFFMGSDDHMYESCLEKCWLEYKRRDYRPGWYYVAVEYSNGFTQNTACLAAMVTKTLWEKAQGFELGSDYGHNAHNIPTSSCEIAFISKMMIAQGGLGGIYEVSKDLLYWVRIHTPGTVGVAP